MATVALAIVLTACQDIISPPDPNMAGRGPSAGSINAALQAAVVVRVCTPVVSVTEDPGLPPGGIPSFSVTAGANSVTIDHVNAGTGLQSLAVVSSTNANVVIPAFAPGTTAPVVVTFDAIDPTQRTEFTLRAGSAYHGVYIRVRCENCTPSLTTTEGDLSPGGLASFAASAGPNSVTVDHVNSGTGLQSLTVMGAPTNATVTIPAFAPGTFNPVVTGFNQDNQTLASDFTLRAASAYHAIFVRAQCPANPPAPLLSGR